MAESRENLVEEEVLLQRAIWRKWNKYTWSGLLCIAIGLIVIVVGLLLDTGPYSAEGLLIGLGIILIIIGIMRLLIGLINPLSPSDLGRSRWRRRKRNQSPLGDPELDLQDQILPGASEDPVV